MATSLRARLFIAQALAIAAGVTVFLAANGHQQRRWVVERSVTVLEHRAELLVRELEREAATRTAWDLSTLGAIFDARLTLIARDGRVLADSEVRAVHLGSVENHGDRPEVRAALAGRTGHASRNSRTVGVELLYVAIPVALGEVAVVRLAEPLSSIAAMNRSLLAVTITAGAGALLLSLLLTFWVTGRHARRVHALERVATSAAQGRAVRAAEQPEDELGRLGRALNHMVGELNRRLENLERERDERERILEHMTDGVVLIDREGRVLRANRSLAAILGMAIPPAPASAFREYVRAPELDELIAAARRRARTAEAEVRLWSPEPRLVHAAATTVGEGDAAATLLVLQDRTEAERVNRVRQDFVANVSHELRTPITSLRGYAETLLAGGLRDEANREPFVRVIRDQAARLQSLVEDLLSLAELERPGAELKRELIDLRAVIDRQVAGFRPAAARAGLTLDLDAGAPVMVAVDVRRIEQVIANLLDNAIKYTETGGVRVTIDGDAGHVWCEIADTGPGILDEDQDRVFERFYRVDKARSRAQGGTGLGLSIVKHIIALHGGRLSLRSGASGGSMFRFEIPTAG